jgi:lambda family phage minor tail protein L
MGVAADVAGLDPVEVVEMYVWDATAIGDTEPPIRWHPGTTVAGTAIIWQGNSYQPMPIKGTNYERAGTGALPRPRLEASNIGGYVGEYLRRINNGLGAKVTRKRTLGKYLDAANFPGGNPEADPTAQFPDEIFYVARKMSENAIAVVMELAVRFDLQGVQIPRRQVIAGTCQWVYRSAECSYAGPPVEDINGNPTSDPALDKCRKTVSACKARFGANGVLRTSAFPASMLGRVS